MLSLIFRVFSVRLSSTEASLKLGMDRTLSISDLAPDDLDAFIAEAQRIKGLDAPVASQSVAEPIIAPVKLAFWSRLNAPTTVAQLAALIGVDRNPDTGKTFTIALADNTKARASVLKAAELMEALEVDSLTPVYLEFWRGILQFSGTDDQLIAQINKQQVRDYQNNKVTYTFVPFDAATMVHEAGTLINQDPLMTEAIMVALAAKAKAKGLSNADKISSPNLAASRSVYKLLNAADVHNRFGAYWLWAGPHTGGLKEDGPAVLADRLDIKNIRDSRFCRRDVDDDDWDINGAGNRGNLVGAVAVFAED